MCEGLASLGLYSTMLARGAPLFSLTSGGLRRASMLSILYLRYVIIDYAGTAVLLSRPDPVCIHRGVTDLLILWRLWASAAVCFLMVSAVAWLVPVAAGTVSLYQVSTSWTIRHRAIRRLAGTRLNQGAGMVLTQVALGQGAAATFASEEPAP